MEKAYYCIQQSFYEEDYTYYFYGPKVDDWKKLCQSILDQAAINAIKEAKKNNCPKYIYCREIYEELIKILENEGYTFINKHVDSIWENWGGDLILPETHFGDSTDLEKKMSKKTLDEIKSYHESCNKNTSSSQEEV